MQIYKNYKMYNKIYLIKVNLEKSCIPSVFKKCFIKRGEGNGGEKEENKGEEREGKKGG